MSWNPFVKQDNNPYRPKVSDLKAEVKRVLNNNNSVIFIDTEGIKPSLQQAGIETPDVLFYWENAPIWLWFSPPRERPLGKHTLNWLEKLGILNVYINTPHTILELISDLEYAVTTVDMSFSLWRTHIVDLQSKYDIMSFDMDTYYNSQKMENERIKNEKAT